MRLRIILLAIATTSLVLVSFLVPLALVLRTLAADRAMSAATEEGQSLALLVPTVSEHNLTLEIEQMNAESGTVAKIYPPGTASASPAVRLASRGRSFSVAAPGGEQVLVAVQGLKAGPAVVQVFVPDSVLRRGVARAWLVLGAVGLFLLLLSIGVADLLARSLVRPLTAVAAVSDLLAAGDLSARAVETGHEGGPPEVRRAGAGLNRLADRIGDLLARERETVADLSHRLRTPLTALRIDAESDDPASRRALLADVAAVERTVSEIIHEARHPRAAPSGAAVVCDASAVIAARAAFWQPLAEDQARSMRVEVAHGPVLVRASAEDLAACADVLLENVFAHTPEGADFAVRLSRRSGGGAWLVVADDGPGFAAGPADSTRRGLSGGGSTGLGLDIARRITEAASGTLTIGRSPSGGGSVTVSLAAPPEAAMATGRRHRRDR